MSMEKRNPDIATGGPADQSRAALRENVYSEIKRGVLDGELQPGQALSEITTARRFMTSRSPVREAMNRLEQEGYLLRKASGRVIVAPLDAQELWNLYLVRASVEGLAARLASPRLTGLALDQLSEHLELMDETSRRGDLGLSLEAGGRFHDTISRHCGNPPLIDVIEGIRGKIKRYQRMIATARHKSLRIREHRDILSALDKRDADSAERLMREHILRSAQSVMQAMEAHPS